MVSTMCCERRMLLRYVHTFFIHNHSRCWGPSFMNPPIIVVRAIELLVNSTLVCVVPIHASGLNSGGCIQKRSDVGSGKGHVWECEWYFVSC